jgi:hypothetical protein
MIKSPSLPKNKDPNGRTTKPAANVVKVARKAAMGLSFGKNCVEIITDKLPKTKKSYHSITVPTEAAVMRELILWLRLVLFFYRFMYFKN